MNTEEKAAPKHIPLSLNGANNDSRIAQEKAAEKYAKKSKAVMLLGYHKLRLEEAFLAGDKSGYARARAKFECVHSGGICFIAKSSAPHKSDALDNEIAKMRRDKHPKPQYCPTHHRELHPDGSCFDCSIDKHPQKKVSK